MRDRSHYERLPERFAETTKLPEMNTVGPSSIRNHGSLHYVTHSLVFSRTQLPKNKKEKQIEEEEGRRKEEEEMNKKEEEKERKERGKEGKEK